jgi:hypothetical protein
MNVDAVRGGVSCIAWLGRWWRAFADDLPALWRLLNFVLHWHARRRNREHPDEVGPRIACGTHFRPVMVYIIALGSACARDVFHADDSADRCNLVGSRGANDAANLAHVLHGNRRAHSGPLGQQHDWQEKEGN